MKKQPDNMLQVIIFIFLLIPIAIYYILKWIVKGIAHIVLAFKSDSTYKKFKYTDLTQVDLLDGVSFKRFVAELLKKHGYTHVKVTKASGDFGVDVLGSKDKKLWAFRCKRYQGNLGLKPVQEIYSGSHKYKADVAVVVTNSYFTNAAKELADDLSVVLWDRDMLVDMMNANEISDNIGTELMKENISTPAAKIKKPRIIKPGVNQLTANVYVIGKEIPSGTYDFRCVFGSGSILKSTSDSTLLGDTNFFQWIGSEYDYQSEQCIGVICKDGEHLHIDGNVVVEIRKSQKVQIEL